MLGTEVEDRLVDPDKLQVCQPGALFTSAWIVAKKFEVVLATAVDDVLDLMDELEVNALLSLGSR